MKLPKINLTFGGMIALGALAGAVYLASKAAAGTAAVFDSAVDARDGVSTDIGDLFDLLNGTDDHLNDALSPVPPFADGGG